MRARLVKEQDNNKYNIYKQNNMPNVSNRKLENQAKHKQMLHALHKFQDKIDGLATDDLIKSEAYIQLSASNKDLFDEFKYLFDEIISMKTAWAELMGNPWIAQYEDVNYHKRQHTTREHKVNNPNYTPCPCGDWISKYRYNLDGVKIYNPRCMIDHTKTEKCMSNRARLKWEALSKCKLSKIIKIDKYLLLNSHINHMYHDESPKLFNVNLLRMLVRRRHIRNLGND